MLWKYNDGMKCVDCHPAGKSATDPRIAVHGEHQFGKGDDPGGLARNDFDDTCISCADCHDTGRSDNPPQATTRSWPYKT